MPVRIAIDYSHVMSANVGAAHGLTETQFDLLQPLLERAHAEIIADAHDGRHLELGFWDLPETMAEVTPRLREVAAELQMLADAHVVLGIGGSYLGARMLSEALGHRHHNELPRLRRGGWPRVYFEGNGLDNDSLVDLLDLLHDQDVTAHVVSKSGDTLETAIAYRLLRQACGERLRGVAVTTDAQSRLRDFAVLRGVAPERIFELPANVGGRYSVLTPVGLFPAAMLGLDLDRLLSGAAEMREFCRSSAWRENPAYLYAAVQHLALLHGRNVSVMAVWDKGLEAFGLWYDQLSAESLGKEDRGRTPLTAVCTRELHSRGQQHQQGTRDKLITNLVVEHPRRTSLLLGPDPGDAEEAAANGAGGSMASSELDTTDGLYYVAGKSLAELNDAAYRATDTAYAKVQRPGLTITAGTVDEEHLGALIFLFELATVVEGKLMAINPLDQPGVQAYKDFLTGLLGKPGAESFRAEYVQRRETTQRYLWP